MKPINFPEAHQTLGQPPDWDEAKYGVVEGLRVARISGTIMSVWQPTDEERAAIANGASIELYVFGDGMPPVAVEVRNER